MTLSHRFNIPILKVGNREWGTRGPLWGLGAMGRDFHVFVVYAAHGVSCKSDLAISLGQAGCPPHKNFIDTCGMGRKARPTYFCKKRSV